MKYPAKKHLRHQERLFLQLPEEACIQNEEKSRFAPRHHKTYAYNLASIDYNDSTPDVSFTYNRLGQKTNITDATGTRALTYNGQFELASEAVSGIYSKTANWSYDALGRSAGMNIASEYDVDYSYDATGRFSTLTNGSDTFTYGYLANSDLISSIAYPNNITISKTYETNRDLLTSVENKYGTTSVSRYDYVNDATGRRTAMAKSGTAFTQSDTISYAYNNRSEVTSAAATNETLYNYAYSFDNIGNRLTASERGVSSSYTSNALNQYTAIDITTPTYDYDGNMLTNGLDWAYTYNGENRMIKAESGTTKVEFTYDYMGREVARKTTENETVTSHIKYVWDAWNKIEELNALDSNSILKKYVWGLDLVGSLTKSGGVGALLSETNSNGTVYATYDANGNVSEYLNNSGTVSAHYEYGPFGQIVNQSGAYADSFSYRFSTKEYEPHTGLVLYQLRPLDTALGRFTSKDPIEEKGGLNLYISAGNSLVNRIDKLGLADPFMEHTTANDDGTRRMYKPESKPVPTPVENLPDNDPVTQTKIDVCFHACITVRREAKFKCNCKNPPKEWEETCFLANSSTHCWASCKTSLKEVEKQYGDIGKWQNGKWIYNTNNKADQKRREMIKWTDKLDRIVAPCCEGASRSRVDSNE